MRMAKSGISSSYRGLNGQKVVNGFADPLSHPEAVSRSRSRNPSHRFLMIMVLFLTISQLHIYMTLSTSSFADLLKSKGLPEQEESNSVPSEMLRLQNSSANCSRIDLETERAKWMETVAGGMNAKPCNCSKSPVRNASTELAELIQSKIGKQFIYVYEIGSEYNVDLQKAKIRWWSGQYEPEYELFEMFAQRNISRTMDPSAATLFYIPFLSARYTLLETKEDDPAVMLEAVRKTSQSWCTILKKIRAEYPFFNRSNGRDHFSALTMDHGRCHAVTFCNPTVYGEMFFFQLNADKMVRSIHMSTTRGIQALTFNYGKKVSNDIPDIPCYISDRDVAIPPMSTMKNVTRPGESDRPIVALFRFSAGQHHGVPIPHFNHFLRRELLDMYKDKGYEGWSMATKSEWSTRKDWERAKFCICPPGHSQWTSRPAKSIIAGCIPINFFRDHDYPWMEELDHSRFTINIDPDRIDTLKSVIDDILSKPDILRKMYKQMELAQEAYQWGPGFKNGARAHVLRILQRRSLKLLGFKIPR